MAPSASQARHLPRYAGEEKFTRFRDQFSGADNILNQKNYFLNELPSLSTATRCGFRSASTVCFFVEDNMYSSAAQDDNDEEDRYFAARAQDAIADFNGDPRDRALALQYWQIYEGSAPPEEDDE